MKRTRNILVGILLIAFGSLGIYCSVRGMLAARDLHGQPDIDDEVRNWSIGATACFVAAGVVSVQARRRREVEAQSQASGRPAQFSWWKSPIGLTLIVVAAVLLGVVVAMLAHRRTRAVSPARMNERLAVPTTVDVPADAGR